jgi:hypothetical protein
MKQNKIYTLRMGGTPVAPGATQNTSFQVNNQNRVSKIKSLWWDIEIYNNLSIPLPLAIQTTQRYRLSIASVTGVKFAQIFENISGNLLSTGDVMFLFKPGQITFDSFYINTTLIFALWYDNYDVAVSYTYDCSVALEIEDITEY